MKNKVKNIICSILAALIVISSFTIYGLNVSKNDYINDLTDIYKEYDANINEEEKNQEFGYRRLIVNDYDGNSYNASKIAYDRNSKLAVLQYDTVDSAIKAYNKMLENGLEVDIESPVELQNKYGICEVDPQSSNLMEIPQYVNNYQMDYDDITVAVIDAGVMLDHSEMQGRFYSRGFDFTTDQHKDADYGTYVSADASSHGTLVSGIIANNTPNNVKILPMKVVPEGKTSTTLSAIYSAMNKAIEMNVQVMNISMAGNSGATTYKNIIENAKKKNICVCVSSGNNGASVSNYFPAAIPDAITVGSVNNNKEYQSFSNYGKEIDFVAPGYRVVAFSPSPKGESARGIATGTSFSAPFVTACLANIKCINKDLKVDDINNLMCSKSVDLGNPGKDDYFGNGLVTMGNYVFSDDSYTYKIPQGTLEIYKSKDYVENTQPWRMFNNKIKIVNVSSDLLNIGDYNFYNMSNAKFNLPSNILNVGKYAFYGCKSISQMTFDKNVTGIGIGAFGNLKPDFVINGYDNTPAQVYAKAENIKFNSLGCNHNYVVDVIEPTPTENGCMMYTCSVCGDSYKSDYIEPKIIQSGKCGPNLSFYLYDIGKLKIEGSGNMYDYNLEPSPWLSNARTIKLLQISNGVNSIEPLAFYGCNNLVKINNFSDNYKVVDDCLYSSDMTKLVLYAGGKNQTQFNFDKNIIDINASAFICANKLVNIRSNNNFVIKDNILYDKLGNIIMFMPNCRLKEINIKEPITIKQNAMILCDSVDKIVIEHPNVVFENYCIGYKYNGKMDKRLFIIVGCDKASAQEYANKNGFNYFQTNSGYCGDSIVWNYDDASKTLTLDGSGNMFDFTSAADIPWSKLMSNITKVIIGENVGKLSRFAFYNATALVDLTIPISIKASLDDTTWYNCANIETLKFTHGSGYMDDYGTDYNQIIYKYTPWYLSRKAIKTCAFDSYVKYIGNYAFRNCQPIKDLVLYDCEKIGNLAFHNCTSLSQIKIYSKNTEITDYSLFSYNNGGYFIYGGTKIYGYVGSTSQAYCDKFGVEFIPVDCNHSVRGTLTNKANLNVSDAEFYLDGILKATTNSDGEFICSGLVCGNYSYKLVYNGVILSQGNINIEHANYNVNVCVPVGDYVSDGVINTKDFAKANQMGYRTDNIDLGEAFAATQATFQKDAA